VTLVSSVEGQSLSEKYGHHREYHLIDTVRIKCLGNDTAAVDINTSTSRHPCSFLAQLSYVATMCRHRDGSIGHRPRPSDQDRCRPVRPRATKSHDNVKGPSPHEQCTGLLHEIGEAHGTRIALLIGVRFAEPAEIIVKTRDEPVERNRTIDLKLA
jgi:hypothetical protein